ncbi:MAG: hypothetical protein ACI959_001992 [Limisphaerales bacterium]|jgi:hypothetical protein
MSIALVGLFISSIFNFTTEENSLDKASALIAHEFYVCVVELDYKPKSEKVELAVRFFLDDLQEALSMERMNPYRVDSKSDDEFEKDLMQYIKNHLEIKLGNKALTKELNDIDYIDFELLGKEVNEEELWVYLEAGFSGTASHVGFYCDLLTEVYSSQQNHVLFRTGTFSKRWTFHKGYLEDQVKFELIEESD